MWDAKAVRAPLEEASRVPADAHVPAGTELGMRPKQ